VKTHLRKDTTVNLSEIVILGLLKANPGYAHVTADGTKLYALIPDTDDMIVWTGDFHSMTEEKVNQFIQDSLAA
jgi:hypothetical protein